jgi:flagellar hook-associated protein FlgK
MNLYNLALTGMNAAQARLTVTGHNINNADTEGYNRQSVIVSTAGATGTTTGFYGRGVKVDSVMRAYDSFLYKQLVSSQSVGAQLVTYGEQLGQINNLLADRTVGVAPAIINFFDAVDAVASAPADPAARQELIGRAGNLVTQINEVSRFLDDQRNDVNVQIETTVAQINSYVVRISELNQQIAEAKAATTGQPPNDLYDQRDQLVTELNQLVKVNVMEQGDSFNISVGNGQVLLSGKSVFPLKAVASSSDPTRVVVAYTAPTGEPGKTMTVELEDKVITGGKLGGLLQYRTESLDVLQNDLGRMAIGLALAFNAQHTQGVDLNGNPGGAFFNMTAPAGIANSKNAGTGVVTIAYGDIDQLTNADYEIVFDGANYTITREPAGTVVYLGDGSDLSGTPPRLIDGIQFNLSGAPVAGDKWLVQPTRHAARDLGLAITDPGAIAAADVAGGSANGNNALELAKLRTAKIMGRGTLSINEAFSQLVNTAGVQMQQISTASKAQANLIEQNLAAQQALSGVNLNEEYVYLMRYQEQFSAAARLIDVGSKVFDTLLGLR